MHPWENMPFLSTNLMCRQRHKEYPIMSWDIIFNTANNLYLTALYTHTARCTLGDFVVLWHGLIYASYGRTQFSPNYSYCLYGQRYRVKDNKRETFGIHCHSLSNGTSAFSIRVRSHVSMDNLYADTFRVSIPVIPNCCSQLAFLQLSLTDVVCFYKWFPSISETRGVNSGTLAPNTVMNTSHITGYTASGSMVIVFYGLFPRRAHAHTISVTSR